MGELQAASSRIAEAGGTLIASSADSAEQAQELRSRLGLTFPILSDPDLAIAGAFGVRQEGRNAALPSAFVLDENGKVTFRYVGVEPGDRPAVSRLIEALEAL